MNHERTIRDWLDQPVDHKEHSLEPTRKAPRSERLCFIVACNGGRFDVSGWGVIGYRGGPFRSGIEEGEAMELVFYNGFIDAVDLLTGGGFNSIFQPIFEAFLKERIEAYEKHKLSAA